MQFTCILLFCMTAEDKLVLENVVCSECGTVNWLNTEKHRSRKKWCRNCRAVVAERTRGFNLNWPEIKRHIREMRIRMRWSTQKWLMRQRRMRDSAMEGVFW